MFITIIRTVILYFVVIFAIRLMGKRQVGDLQPGELVITILISEIAANPIQDLNQPVLSGIITIITLAVVEIFISGTAMKFFKARKLINGNSVIIIRDGILDQKAMKKLRITVPDLLEVLRGESVFNIEEVAWAILETNGKISVLLKPRHRPVTQGGFGEDSEDGGMPCLVISDGFFMSDGLKTSGATKQGVNNLLKKKRILVSDVFLMTIDKSGSHTIIRRDAK